MMLSFFAVDRLRSGDRGFRLRFRSTVKKVFADERCLAIPLLVLVVFSTWVRWEVNEPTSRTPDERHYSQQASVLNEMETRQFLCPG